MTTYLSINDSATPTNDACTTILVASGATADGSRIIARTEDHDPCLSKVLLKHPARDSASGEFHANKNGFTYPIPPKAFAYASFSDGLPDKREDQMTWGAAGFNERGVGMTATETIFASEQALKNDPYLPDTGITEDSITDVILPYIETAKEGALRLGKIIEEKGAGEGFGVAFVDGDAIWYLETGSGHQWMAARVPAECYFVTGNQGRLRKYDPRDTDNYLGSATLIDYAIENGLYQPEKDGEFDFERAYTLHNATHDAYYNYPRVFVLQHLYSEGIDTVLNEPEKFRVFEKPSRKLTVDDVKAGLRNTYDTLGRMPYTSLPDYSLRPISLFRTQQSHILHCRNNLPPAIANVTYVSWGMPATSIYIPLYTNSLDDFPAEYKQATDGKADSFSAQWRFRKLQTLAMVDYYRYAPIVREGYQAAEKKFSTLQRELEVRYLATLKDSPEQAAQLVAQFHADVFRQALEVTETLTNRIFTLLTQDLNRRYSFSGA